MREYNPLSTDMTMDEEMIEVVDFEPEMDLDSMITKANMQGIDALTDEEYAFVMLELNASEGGFEAPDDHFANLAEYIDARELMKIGKKVVEWVEDDEQTRDMDVETGGVRRARDGTPLGGQWDEHPHPSVIGSGNVGKEVSLAPS